MIPGKLIVDGVLHKWLPSAIERQGANMRSSEATVSLKGVQHAVLERAGGRRSAGATYLLKWSAKTYMSQTQHDAFLSLFSLGRPFWFRQDDAFGSEGETLTAVDTDTFQFSIRRVKPYAWSPLDKRDWTGCIFVDGVASSVSAFEVDEEEGVVVFDSPPAGTVSAKYSLWAPVVIPSDGFQLSAVPNIMVSECDMMPAYQGLIKLVEVEDALERWPIRTGCLSGYSIDVGRGGGDDDDLWEEIIPPPLPTVKRRKKTILPTDTAKVQAACGNVDSRFPFEWPALDLPYDGHLLKATFSAKIAEDTGQDFWILPVSQDFEGLIMAPNNSEETFSSKMIGSQISSFFTTGRRVSYSSPYFGSGVLDWRWLAGRLNSDETFDTINPAVPLPPVSDGFLNYAEVNGAADMKTLMTAAVNTANHSFSAYGITGNGRVVWDGGQEDAKLEVVQTSSPFAIEYKIDPVKIFSPPPPSPVAFINEFAKVSGSLKLKIKWNKVSLGRLNKLTINFDVRVMATASSWPSWYDSNIIGSSRRTKAVLGRNSKTLKEGTNLANGQFEGASVTDTIILTETIEQDIFFDEETQIAQTRDIGVLADAQSLSGTSQIDSSAGTSNAAASVKVQVNSLSCGGQKIDLDDVQIEAEWLPLSCWALVPDADGETGGLDAGVWTQSGVIELGDHESPAVNSVAGDGFNGGFIHVPAASGRPGALFRSLENALREYAPTTHGSDEVTGVRIRLQAKGVSGGSDLSACVLRENDFSEEGAWNTAQAFVLTDAWQTFTFDLPYSSLIHGEFTTISDLASCMFGIFAGEEFYIRNILAGVYYIHEDL